MNRFNYFGKYSGTFKMLIINYTRCVLKKIGIDDINKINNIDRVKAAKKFYDFRTDNNRYEIVSDEYIEDVYTKEQLIKDIALFIDLQLPRQIYITKNLDYKNGFNGEKLAILYKGISTVPGAKYKYTENYDNEKEFTNILEGQYRYKKFSNDILRKMLQNSLKNAGFELKKDITLLERIELEKLLTYFYDNETVIPNIMEYCDYRI